MKLDILDNSKNKVGEISLPMQFGEDVRVDLVKRAVLALQSGRKQAYGAMKEAGKRASANLSKRRKKYRGMYGFGISRTPRKILSRRGTRMFWVGAVSPNTVGGRKAHPPKATKIWDKKINIKERKKAIRSAIASTINKDLVVKRGHLIDAVPLILENKLEGLSKTKEILSVMKKVGLDKELERVKIKKVRAGKGKNRGRKYKTKVGPLIVVSENCKLEKSAINIQGVDVIKVNNLNAEVLSPGTYPGRLVIWSEKSIEKLGKENLFV